MNGKIKLVNKKLLGIESMRLIVECVFKQLTGELKDWFWLNVRNISSINRFLSSRFFCVSFVKYMWHILCMCFVFVFVFICGCVLYIECVYVCVNVFCLIYLLQIRHHTKCLYFILFFRFNSLICSHRWIFTNWILSHRYGCVPCLISMISNPSTASNSKC